MPGYALGGRERGDMVMHPIRQNDRHAREMREDGDHSVGSGTLRRLPAGGRIDAGEMLATLLQRGAQLVLGQRQDAQGQTQGSGQPSSDGIPFSAARRRDRAGNRCACGRKRNGSACRCRPFFLSPEVCAQPQERLSATAHRRYGRHDTTICRAAWSGADAACGLAHHVWTNGRYVYYRCRGADTLLNRVRPDPCQARQLPTADRDALVWAAICAVLNEPPILEEAVCQAQQGWLHAAPD